MGKKGYGDVPLVRVPFLGLSNPNQGAVFTLFNYSIPDRVRFYLIQRTFYDLFALKDMFIVKSDGIHRKIKYKY